MQRVRQTGYLTHSAECDVGIQHSHSRPVHDFADEREALFESQRFNPPSVRPCDDRRVEAMLRDVSSHSEYAVEQFWRHIIEGCLWRQNEWEKLLEETLVNIC